MLKKICVTVISLALITSFLLASAFGASAEEEPFIPPIEVTYSDLFYGYHSNYLRSSQFLDFVDESTEITDRVYMDFLDSPKCFFAEVRSGITATTGLLDMLKLISDKYKDTNYNYEAAIDAANLMFVESFTKASTLSKDYLGMQATGMEALESLLEVYDEFDEFHDLYTERPKDDETTEIMLNEFFRLLYQKKIYKNISNKNLEEIKPLVLKDIPYWDKSVPLAAAGYNGLKALSMALVIEDMQIEVVNTIIRYSSNRPVLRNGMIRLRDQLVNSVLENVGDIYLKELVMEKLCDALVDFTIGKISAYGLITGLLDLFSTIVLGGIFDVPEMEDIFVQMALCEYSNDMWYIVTEKMESFEGQFYSDEIKDFEVLFESYVAITNASLEASEELTVSSNRSELAGIKYKYENFNYAAYISGVRQDIRMTPLMERKLKKVDDVWVVNKPTVIEPSTNLIYSNRFFAFGSQFRPELRVENKTRLIGDLTFNENVSVSGSNAELLVEKIDTQIFKKDINVQGQGVITNNGVMDVKGNIVVNYSGNIVNIGTIYANGDLKTINSNAYICQNEENAKIYVRGNMEFYTHNNNQKITGGMIILDGKTRQKVKAQVFNARVDNLEGIEGTLHVYGHFDLNLHPFEGEIYAYDGATFEYPSDYDTIKITSDFTLRSNVIADFEIAGSAAKLSVAENSSHWIYGNVKLSGGNSNTKAYLNIADNAFLCVDGNIENSYYSDINNRGTLRCTGNITTGYGGNFINSGTVYCDGDFVTNNSNIKIIQNTDSAKMYIRGDMLFYYRNNDALISAGTVIFDGDSPQKINAQVYNFLVTNKSAINGDVDLYGHIDINNCPWVGTVYAYDGATFADGSDYNKVVITKNFTMRSDIGADVTVSGSAGKLTVENGGDYTILGTLSVIGSNSSYISSVEILSGGKLKVAEGIATVNYATVTNNGILTCKNIYVDYCGNLINRGTLYCDGEFKTRNSNIKVIQDVDSAKMYIRGDMLFYYRNNDALISAGTVIFDGKTVQNLNAQCFNMHVHNPAALIGDIEVYGNANLFGNIFVGTIYAYDGATFADGSDYNKVVITKNFTIRSDIGADVTVSGSAGKLTVENGGDYTILGTLSVIGSNSSYISSVEILSGGKLKVAEGIATVNYATVTNNGILTCKNIYVDYCGNLINRGTLYCDGEFKTRNSNIKVIQDVDSAKMYIRGDMYFYYRNNDALISAGTVIFDGKTVQNLNAQCFNMQVYNPAALIGDIEVYGNANLFGNIFVGTIYAYDGATFADGSDYNKVVITKDFIMRSDIGADVTVSGSAGKLTVENGGDYTILGTLSVIGSNSSYISSVEILSGGKLKVAEGIATVNYATVTNNGILSCKNIYVDYCGNLINRGTLYCDGDFICRNSNIKIIQDAEDAAAYIGGNVDWYSTSQGLVSEGKVIFNGNFIQNIKNFNAPTIIVENNINGGANFITAISPSVLFDHSGKNFIFADGSVFVDYDLDGITDEKDAEPTVFQYDYYEKLCDLNGDGVADIRDMVRLKKELSLSKDETEDINGDGKSDSIDLIIIRCVLIRDDRLLARKDSVKI